MPLNPEKLQNVRQLGGGAFKSQCPQCALEGHDSQGNHLHVDEKGSFGCAVDRSRSHWDQIFALAGFGEGETYMFVAPEPKIEMPRTWPADCLKRLIRDNSYWRGRGVSDEVADSLRGGVATEGQLKSRWVVPLFNDEDEIVGFTGRTLLPDGKPRWKHLGKTSEWILGDIAAIEEARRVVLVESVGDYCALATHGVKECLVLFGVNISQAVMAKIVSLNPQRIVVSTNSDEKHSVGQDAAARIARSLGRFFDDGVTEVVLPQTGKDWGCADPVEIRRVFVLDTPPNSVTL